MYRAPGPAVVRRAAVVTEYQIIFGGNAHRRHRLPVAVLVRYVAFFEPLPVDDHGAVVDLDNVAGHSDNPLDVGLGLVHREPENHHVAALNVTDAELVNE